ncbi:hypothetical protein BB2000_2042 [Proteus mirabilis BB2000]|nr:hypothetical protein BB2000_2042 [Proteus mirabilis BB2000]
MINGYFFSIFNLLLVFSFSIKVINTAVSLFGDFLP